MRIKIFTVTKNEYDLIEDWILYHASLVGFDNVVIIDNGSDSAVVLQIYEKYKDKIHIELRPSYENNKQGEHFTEVMHKYKDQADFLVGLDTDEFLVKKTNHDIIVDKAEILSEFENFGAQYGYGMIKTHVNSCSYGVPRFVRPVVEMTKFVRNDVSIIDYKGPSRCYNKAFYAAKHFINTLNGNHDGRTKLNSPPGWPALAMLHFHDLGWERNLERARQTVLAYNYIREEDDNKAAMDKLKRLHGGCYGCHRVAEYLRYLTHGEHTFNKQHNYETEVFCNYMLTLKV